MRVLIDTNVILDVWLAREPFLRDSAGLLSAAERKQIVGIVSPTTVTTLHYLVSKAKGEVRARALLCKLLQICEVADLGRREVEASLESKVSDCEDAVIEAAAISAEAGVIATRNLQDFKKSQVKALEPQQIRW